MHESKLPEGRVRLSGSNPGRCLLTECVWEWGYVYPDKGKAIPFVRAVWCKPEDYPSETAHSHVFVLKPSQDLYKYLKKQGIYGAKAQENAEKRGNVLL